jgi:hypothetical protein
LQRHLGHRETITASEKFRGAEKHFLSASAGEFLEFFNSMKFALTAI